MSLEETLEILDLMEQQTKLIKELMLKVAEVKL